MNFKDFKNWLKKELLVKVLFTLFIYKLREICSTGIICCNAKHDFISKKTIIVYFKILNCFCDFFCVT